MKWEVSGTWAGNGTAATMTVSAPTEQEARAIVASQGVRVTGAKIATLKAGKPESFPSTVAGPASARTTLRTIRVCLLLTWVLCSVIVIVDGPPIFYVLGSLVFVGWLALLIVGFAMRTSGHAK